MAAPQQPAQLFVMLQFLIVGLPLRIRMPAPLNSSRMAPLGVDPLVMVKPSRAAFRAAWSVGYSEGTSSTPAAATSARAGRGLLPDPAFDQYVEWKALNISTLLKGK